MSFYKLNNPSGIVLNDGTGSVSIGTASSTSKFTVAGSVTLFTGNQGLGKILVSDALGNADWAPMTNMVGVVTGTGSTNYAVKWTGTNSTIGDSTWAYSGNSYYPVTPGSNIGLSNSNVGTIYLSNIDYSSLIFSESGVETARFQNGTLGLGTSSPSPTAIFDITSTTKGFLKPRMTSIQRDLISTPSIGLEIFNTTTNLPNFFNGTSWESLTTQPLVRYIYLVSDTIDQSYMGGTTSNVYTTFQTAYDAANVIQIGLGGTNNVVIDIGVISSDQSGDLTLTSDWNPNVILVGMGKSVSILGNIISSNTTNGFNVNISTRGVTIIGNIDCSSTSSGNGGVININGDITIGNLISNGAGNGNGGDITVGLNKQGVILINDVTSNGNGSGNGGNIQISNSNVGNVSSSGGTSGKSGIIIIIDSKTLDITSINNSGLVGGLLTLTRSNISNITYINSSSGNGGVIDINEVDSISVNITRNGSGLLGTFSMKNSNISSNIVFTIGTSSTGNDTIIPYIINSNISGDINISNTSVASAVIGLNLKEVEVTNLNYTNQGTGAPNLINIYDTDFTGNISVIVVSASKIPAINILSGSSVNSVILNNSVGSIGQLTVNGSSVSSLNIVSSSTKPTLFSSTNSIVTGINGSLTSSFKVTSDNSTISVGDLQAGSIFFTDINCDMSYHVGNDLGILNYLVINSKSSKWDFIQGTGYTTTTYDLTLFDTVISDNTIPFTQNVLIKSEGSYIHSISALNTNSKINRTSIGTVNNPSVGVDNISGTGIQFDYCTLKGSTYCLSATASVGVSQKFCVNDGPINSNITLT
jgi:hypothetical protein